MSWPPKRIVVESVFIGREECRAIWEGRLGIAGIGISTWSV